MKQTKIKNAPKYSLNKKNSFLRQTLVQLPLKLSFRGNDFGHFLI